MKNTAIVMVVALCISASAIAQTKDYGEWTTIGAEKSLGKWTLGTEAELRTKDYLNLIDRWSLKLEAQYNVFKDIQIGANYQFMYYHDTKYWDYQPRHRYNAFVQGKYRLKNFTFSLRERAQLTTKDESDRIKKSGKIDTYKINPEWTWRNRMKIAYDIPGFPITPAFSLETFYQLNNPDGNQFDNLRYTLSFSYKLSRHHQFEVYGLIDKEINIDNPVKTYIAGVGYTFSF